MNKIYAQQIMSDGVKIPAGLNMPDASLLMKKAGEMKEKDLSSLLSDPKIANEVMKKFSTNQEDMFAMGEELIKTVDPNVVEKARKMATNGNLDKMMKDVRKQGISPSMARKMKRNTDVDHLARRQKETKLFNSVLITSGRQIKDKKLDANNNLDNQLSKLVQDQPTILHCPELSIGELSEMKIYIAYRQVKSINKRATRVFGKNVGGDVVFFAENRDFLTRNFEYLEQHVDKIEAKRSEIEKQNSADLDDILKDI